MTLPIEVCSLSKQYESGLFKRNRLEALHSLDLVVQEGEILAFLGPNGAGKTTTINLVMGFLKPSSGTVRLFGQHPENAQVKQKIGYLPENYSFYSHMSAMQLLNYFADLLDLSKVDRTTRVEKLLMQLDLWKARKRPIGGYSRGMKQRLGIAQALLKNPSLLILDEPTSGFDPAGRKMIRDLLIELKSGGTSVLLSSHILSEVETMCDRVSILNRGQLLKHGTLAEILGQQSYAVIFDLTNDTVEQQMTGFGCQITEKEGRKTITTHDFELAQTISRLILNSGGKLHSLIPQQKTLEDAYLFAVQEHDQKVLNVEQP